MLTSYRRFLKIVVYKIRSKFLRASYIISICIIVGRLEDMATTEQIVKRTLESKAESKRITDLYIEHKENSKWVAKNIEDLRKRFPDKYIAVQRKDVIEDDADLIELITKLRKRNLDIDTITIEYVTTKPIKLLL